MNRRSANATSSSSEDDIQAAQTWNARHIGDEGHTSYSTPEAVWERHQESLTHKELQQSLHAVKMNLGKSERTSYLFEDEDDSSAPSSTSSSDAEIDADSDGGPVRLCAIDDFVLKSRVINPDRTVSHHKDSS